MQESSTKKIYDIHSVFYDATFGRLVKRRIERAKTLLADPASSVTDVALELGFSETSSFSAAFRHTAGTTPSEYRRTLA